ncbi:MAG: hypothetical protein IJM09_02395 [Neisseriaceae bacterium]|nr:hypothetical protein [Neisseriaceae bacterium]
MKLDISLYDEDYIDTEICCKRNFSAYKFHFLLGTFVNICFWFALWGCVYSIFLQSPLRYDYIFLIITIILLIYLTRESKIRKILENESKRDLEFWRPYGKIYEANMQIEFFSEKMTVFNSYGEKNYAYQNIDRILFDDKHFLFIFSILEIIPIPLRYLYGKEQELINLFSNSLPKHLKKDRQKLLSLLKNQLSNQTQMNDINNPYSAPKS